MTDAVFWSGGVNKVPMVPAESAGPSLMIPLQTVQAVSVLPLSHAHTLEQGSDFTPKSAATAALRLRLEEARVATGHRSEILLTRTLGSQSQG